MKGVMRFGKMEKLSPIYILPFEILLTVREVVYKLALPLDFAVVHPVSMFLCCDSAFPMRIMCFDGTQFSWMSD